ncbi:hypothetical protein FS749_009917 [Ceratobasidium sp. UAMH 11750]|nr:hypothetical protein FS749_009917 [Ceratobasidium sp. UAMH 11750]
MGAPSLDELNKIAEPLLAPNKSLHLGLSQYYVLDSVTVIVVQGFFAMRAWRVANRNFFVLALIGTFALAAFGGGIAVKVMFTELGSTLHAGDVKIPAYIWLFGTVVADLLITSIIMRYLLTGKTGQPTDHVLSRLVRVTFESQLPPTLIAIGLAIEYTIQYSSFIAIPFICVQAKFYGISLLHTLNSREALKSVSGTAATDDGDIEFARRSGHNTFWLTSRFAATSNDGHGPRAVKGDTHRHTQFTIMPEPRTRRVKAESIDTISFKGVDLGPDEDDTPDVRKPSEVDLSQGGGEITELDIGDEPSGRPRRGGQSKLASMGMAGGIAGMEGERRRD